MRLFLPAAYGLLGALLAVIAASPAGAEDPIGRLSLSLNLGGTTLAMDDVNGRIHAGNEYLRFKGLSIVDDLSYGFDFVGDFKTAIRDPIYITIGAGSLRGSTHKSFNQIIEIDSQATLVYGRLLYALSWRPLENARLFVGGGPVFLQDVALEVGHERDYVAKTPERKETLRLEGTGSGFQMGILGEYLLSDHFTLSLGAGYRRASVQWDSWRVKVENADVQVYQGKDDIHDEEQLFWKYEEVESYLLHSFLEAPEYDPAIDGPPINTLKVVENLDLDFSGVRLEVGLRFYFF